MVLLALAGCRSEAPASDTQTAGPLLVPLDSTLLGEEEEHVGDPWSIAVVPADGSFLVADRFSRRVLRFARSGEFLQSYGRPGGGPGEFVGLTQVLLFDDTVLVANDHQRALLQRFDVRDGRYIDAVRHQGLIGGHQVRGDTVWLGTVDGTRSFSIGRWSLSDDSITYFGPVPREYQESEDYWGHCTMNYLAVSDHSVLLGFCGTNKLFVVGRDGAVRDTLRVPVVRRRGVPDDVVRRFARETSLVRRTEMLSLLQGMHVLADGHVALLHFDSRLSATPPAGQLSSVGYLTLLSPDLQRACVDRRLPTNPDIEPISVFRGDTLFVFDRRLQETSMETWIKRFRVSTEGCEWLPLREERRVAAAR